MNTVNPATQDAANMGLAFIDECALPLAAAIAHLPADHPAISALCRLLQQEAEQYRQALCELGEWQ